MHLRNIQDLTSKSVQKLAKTLHKFNPVRLSYIIQTIKDHFSINSEKDKPLKDLSILDIGCGGGLMCEPLARLGAKVTGIDALEFANVANQNNVRLITSHRSGESTDSQISHIGIATKSKMLKVGVVGGERVAKLNELLRLSGHDFICGMAEI